MEIANIQKNQLVNFNQSQLNKAFLSEGIQVWSKKKSHPFPREILHLKSQWANINQIKLSTNYP